MWTVICIFIIGFLLYYIYRCKKELRSIKDQMEFILKTDTNQLLTVGLFTKEIRELAGILNQILKKHREIDLRMKKTDQAFKQGITNLSHDLRTPLTSAKGYMEMLQSGEVSEEKEKEYMKIISERMEAVQKLQNELFEYVRLEANEKCAVKEPVSLNNTLRDVLSLYYEEYVNRGITPDITIPDTDYKILGNEESVFRIFSNIVYNSLIHGRAPYKIGMEKKFGWYIVSFENYAPDVRTEEVSRLFDRFYTGDKSRGKKTTGLGLSIAKKLAESMDGCIKAAMAEQMLIIEVRWPIPIL